MLTQLVAGLCVVALGVAVPARATDRPAPVEVAAADFAADIVEPYLAVQTALAADDLAPVAGAARTLRKNADALGPDGRTLAAAAERTAQATIIEAARAAFGELSAALIAHADRTKQSVAGRIVAYCPMVDKSWVQRQGAIANPYYGKAMLACGSETRKLSPTR